MAEEYKEIDTSSGEEEVVEISLEDFEDKSKKEEKEEKEPELEVEVKEEETPAEEKQESTPIKKPQTKKKVPRSQKRIKGLLQENAAKDAELLTLQQQMADMQKLAQTSSKQSSESMAQTLEGQIQALQAQFTSAIEEGDAAKTVAVQDELMNAKLQLASTKSDIKTIEAQPEPIVPEAKKPKQEISDRALDWIDAHPEFKTDAIFYSSAMAVNQQLMQEGLDPNNEDFYVELNSRLQPRFADLFDTEEEDTVEYDQGHEKPPSSEETLKDSQSSERLSTPPVAGASRASSVGSKTAKRRNTINLTPIEVMASEELGMTKKEYALRKKHIRDNTADSGYTPILMS